MKKQLVGLGIATLIFGVVESANATLSTIGTATYGGNDYNLIWDDDNNGNSVVWLDYSSAPGSWASTLSWVAGLDGSLTYNIDAGYNVSWDDADWRLGNTVDGAKVSGYEGDPDNDGIYTYTAGYNLANSEIGHLFYEELGNSGYYATDGTTNSFPDSGYFLEETGDFNNLLAYWYWSATEYTTNSENAWFTGMYVGYQSDYSKDNTGLYGLALRSGQVSEVPVPEPATMLLFGTGLVGLVGSRIRKKKK